MTEENRVVDCQTGKLLPTDAEMEAQWKAYTQALNAAGDKTISMRQLAELFIAAQKMHEHSYIASVEECVIGGQYKVSETEAVMSVVGDDVHLIWILDAMGHWSNDSFDWCRDILGLTQEELNTRLNARES